jgi:hypothetical protein
MAYFTVPARAFTPCSPETFDRGLRSGGSVGLGLPGSSDVSLYCTILLQQPIKPDHRYSP